ncbi:hypothetical protein JVT61DRAFT_12404 [Boletus reticuloceps]|uniref:Uncharacterized protein n=1 Tax=Boletus reticuloceps TaxID=495285 RepID=A0A8I2YE64_9AGAM|nr:hypothetical protein JVT61DRAFT_12404 [Boletus reticuloceps]
MKRGLQLISIVGFKALVKGKVMLHAPGTFNKQVGKVTTSEHSFSDQKWGDTTRGITRAVEHCSNTQIAQIHEKAQLLAGKLEPDAGDKSVALETTKDEYARMCE